jgi:hypothetical protein
MRHRFLSCVIGLISLCYVAHAHAGQAQDAELKELSQIQDQLNTQQDWVNYRYDKSVGECYHYFWVQRCMDRARAIYLKQTKIIRTQEIALHDRQRVVNAAIKDERDQLRIADYQDPSKAKERAENRAAFEEKQRLREERIQELEERRKDAPARAQENRKSSPLD